MASEREVKDNKMASAEQKFDTREKDSGTGSSACTLSRPQSSVEYEPGISCMVISCSESTADLPRVIHGNAADSFGQTISVPFVVSRENPSSSCDESSFF